MLLYTPILVFFMTSIELSYGVKCPCKDVSLCKALTIPTRKESFGFATGAARNYRVYDWSKLTTIAIFGTWSEEFICFAHSKNVRVVFNANMPYDKLTDSAFKTKWIESMLNMTLMRFADGINVDIEYEIALHSPQAYALTEWMKELTDAFHKKIPGSQITIDVAWWPHCWDKRCYDMLPLSKVVDFLIVMSYDEASAIFGNICTAKPNSGYYQTASGINAYLKLDIKKEKLVIALPWYGRDYPCISFNEKKNDLCVIRYVPWRGINCTDGASREHDYSAIVKTYLPQKIGEVKYDDISKSPHFQYKDKKTSVTHQMWYDDPRSLKLKYEYVLKLKLRGLGYFGIDSACNIKDMWDAIPKL